jgi:hypothetical protein
MYTKNTTSAENNVGAVNGEDTLCALKEEFGNRLMVDYKNIRVREETHERLQNHGNMDESFDDLITRILDDWEEVQEREEDE